MRVLTVFGTRPEAIKLAPVVQQLALEPNVQHATCVTGQHREMLDQVLSLFQIDPEYDLEIMLPSQSLTSITVAVLEKLEGVMNLFQPDWVLVQGDTTTAFAAALASFYRKVRVAHVEAGLRTGNIYSPWPEEMNRRLVSHLSTLHFAPTERSASNLLAEGIPQSRILVTGNTIIDALQWVSKQLDTAGGNRSRSAQISTLLRSRRRIILVTGHRRENFDGGLERVCRALCRIASRGDVEIVYAVHLNPRVQSVVNQFLGNVPNVNLIAPLGYLDFVEMMKSSFLILTDSGGIQEEAPGLGIPVLVTRDNTERPEAVEAGTAQLVGTDEERVFSAVAELLDNSVAYELVSTAKNPFGDGNAARRIVSKMIQESN